MKFYLLTFGCQMNVYDSERIGGYLCAAGHTPVDREADADLILINTCSIRASAENRVYGTLGRLVRFKRQHPKAILGVVGCMAQKEKDRLFQVAPHLDLVAGTHAVPRIPAMVAAAQQGERHLLWVERELDNAFDPPGSVTAWQDTVRYPAFVTIIQGCNKCCSYCVVPYVRGHEVCRPVDEVLAEVQHLVARGYREVTLIGQNVDSYQHGQTNFAALLTEVNQLDGLSRIRFTTSHPQDMTRELIRTVAELPKVCENFHFPLQAGSNRILKEMRRGYTVEQYFDQLDYLAETFGSRDENPFAYSISTDLMVGFANETEDEYQQTLAAVRRARWDSAFMFKYSRREKTIAWKWDDLLPEEVKNRRLAELIQTQEAISLEINQACLGQTVEVMVEGVLDNVSDPTVRLLKGRTRTNKSMTLSVPVESALPPVGALVDARVTEVKPVTLCGEMVAQSAGCAV